MNLSDEEMAAHEENVVAAQERDEDPDGDNDALDPGDMNEAPSDVDPPEAAQVNPDAEAELPDADDNEDDGTDDYSEVEDPEQDEDPEPEPDDGSA